MTEEEAEKQEFKFLHSDDSDTVCLYLNIILEKYGKYVLTEYMIKNRNKDKDFYLFSGSCITNRNFYNFCYKLICSIFSSLVHETSQMRINYAPFAIYCHPKTCLRFLQLSAEERETVSLLHKKFCIRFSFTY